LDKTVPAFKPETNRSPQPTTGRPLPAEGHLFERALRRGFDLLVAAFGLLGLSPFFLVFAWLIQRDTPGPVFFHGRRAGKDGREFAIHKFRTM
jgi:lipopolysaccharide/colanic/teichoic acid biosynthesis glycosyltransferase